MTGRVIEHEQASNVERVGNVELPHDAIVPQYIPDPAQATPRLRGADGMHGDVAEGHYTIHAGRHVIIAEPEVTDSFSSLDSARRRHATMPQDVPEPREVHRGHTGGEEHTTSAEKHAVIEEPDVTNNDRSLDLARRHRHATTSQDPESMPGTISIHTMPEGLRTALDYSTQAAEEAGEEGDTVLYPLMGRYPDGSVAYRG